MRLPESRLEEMAIMLADFIVTKQYMKTRYMRRNMDDLIKMMHERIVEEVEDNYWEEQWYEHD